VIGGVLKGDIRADQSAFGCVVRTRCPYSEIAIVANVVPDVDLSWRRTSERLHPSTVISLLARRERTRAAQAKNCKFSIQCCRFNLSSIVIVDDPSSDESLTRFR